MLVILDKKCKEEQQLLKNAANPADVTLL